MPKLKRVTSTTVRASDFPLEQIVRVTWVDSASGDGWTDLDTRVANLHPVVCRSVGYLVDATDQEVRLSGSQTRKADGSGVFHGLAIPRCAVQQIDQIALKEPR